MTNQREGSFKFYTSMVAALLGDLLARNRKKKKKKDEMHERPTDTWDGQ